MNVDTKQVEVFTGLAYQYGPFFFAILFNVAITLWAYKMYHGAQRPDEVKTYRAYFLTTVSFGMLLVCLSIYWWWSHPPYYVYKGVIKELEDYQKLTSTDLYFKRELVPRADKNLAQICNDYFLVVREKPFGEAEEFDVWFSRGGDHQERLTLRYMAGEPKFRIEFDAQTGKNALKMTSPGSSPKALLPGRAHAQTAQTAPSAPSRARVRAPAAGPAVDMALINVLQDERTPVGTKIASVDRLGSLPDQEVKSYLESVTQKEPMILTLIDLTRHTDKELSYKAATLVEKRYNPQSFFSQKLLSSNAADRDLATRILFRMEPDRASRYIPASGSSSLDGLRNDVRSGRKARVLIPTGSSGGDRYYVRATWDAKNQQAVNCLTQLFNKSLISQRSPDEETSLMRGRSDRLVYWYSKEWALNIASDIERCGGKAAFAAGIQNRGS